MIILDYYICMTVKRVIFHIDVNSAFLSWSAVKILARGGPDYRLVPAVVSGDPSDRRSIVAAKSIPAKKYGINTAEPVSMALRKYPGLVILRSDFEWYRECSGRFIEICRGYSPVLQQFSIDECFLDMTYRLSGKDPVEVATALKDQIHKELGFTVNVGVASNKLLAKMASDFEKPDKVHTLWEEEIPEKMWPLPVRDLLWVGRQTAAKLTDHGISTIGALARMSPAALKRLLGGKFAEQLVSSANGKDDSPVETEAEEPKSYSAERTLAKDITDAKALDRELFNVACIVSHRIRRDNFRAAEVSVFVKDKDFGVVSKQTQLEQPTDITALILGAARKLVGQIWDGSTPLRQVGLGVSRLTHDATYYQTDLFNPEEADRLEFYRKWDAEYDRTHTRARVVSGLAPEALAPEEE